MHQIKKIKNKIQFFSELKNAAFFSQMYAPYPPPYRAYPYKRYRKKPAKPGKYYKYKAQNLEAKTKALEARRRATEKPGVISEIGQMAGGGLGKLVGTALGSEGGMFTAAAGGAGGGAIGDFLGGKIGHLIEKITGFGDYKVQSNSIMRGGMTAPQIHNTVKNGGVVVRFREYVQDIAATIDFTNHVLPLNPGQSKSFPWLSTFAKNWQQYRWRGIIWEFGSTSSDAVLSSATSSALGTVNMATDYDVLDNDYVSKREMLNTVFANSSKPSCSFIHPIECKRSQTPMSVQYVRVGDYPEGGDPRMYDLGKFQIATEGMQAASGSVGELWVTYEVEFFKQQLGSSAQTDMFALSTCTNLLLLGTVQPVRLVGSTLGGSIGSDGTNNYYEFPSYVSSGRYLCTYWVQGVAAAVGGANVSLSAGTIVDLWNSATTYVQSPAAGVSSISLIQQLVFDLTGSSCRVTFGTQTIPTTANLGNLIITEIPRQLQDN